MSNVQISKFLSVEQTMVTQFNQIVNTRGGLVRGLFSYAHMGQFLQGGKNGRLMSFFFLK